MAPEFRKWYEARKDEILSWRHDLHAHPEVGFDVHRTAAFVADKLRQFGLDVETGIGGTGVVGTLNRPKSANGSNGRTVAFRADMDALPMQEVADVPYRSTDNAKFHGCGHDGHTVTLLTAAAFLAQRDDFSGRVVFIFQPAEEILEGARAMIEDGLLTRHPSAEIYALHNIPGVPAGHVSVVRGGALASSDLIRIEVHAAGSHGATPQEGQDGIMAAAAFLTNLQQAITRSIDSRESAVISFGSIHGGTVGNILPKLVAMEGSMRAHSPAVRDRMAGLVQDSASAVGQIYGVRMEVDIKSAVPVTQNNEECVDAVLDIAERLLGKERIVANPVPIMSAEDFSLFLEHLPGAYFFIGQEGEYCHSPNYVFDDEVIPVGAEIFCDLAITRCNPD